MNNNIAFIFPGQGSQYSGMGAELYSAYQEARDVFNEAQTVLGYDLAKMCFEAPNEVLTLTINAQPAIYTTSMACHRIISNRVFGGVKMRPAALAGHSLGEYSALCAANVYSFTDGLRLVHNRAKFMHEAGQETKGTMAAIVGMQKPRLDELCAEVTKDGKYVAVAIFNSPEQIVISGSIEGVAEAGQKAKAAGASVFPLSVSGAFHSNIMKPAADRLSKVMEEINFYQPDQPVAMNILGSLTQDVATISGAIIKQIYQPLLWVNCVNSLYDMGVRTMIELGPKTVLKGLVKKINREITVLNIEDLKSLENTMKHLEIIAAQAVVA
ncbi:MAG TPA: ACP S-malonyltransferase [Candidatus Wallbacteria bacterium]|nr:ACP S-malonyltransferase [Candidatus Wallbacteria bacterium]